MTSSNLPSGMSFVCPECGCKRARCLETRHITFRGHHFIMRRRSCEHCGFQYKTKEVTVPDEEAPHSQKAYREAKKVSPPQEKTGTPASTEPIIKKVPLPTFVSQVEPKIIDPDQAIEENEKELEVQRNAEPHEMVQDPDDPLPERPSIYEEAQSRKPPRQKKDKRKPKMETARGRPAKIDEKIIEPISPIFPPIKPS